jgi:hypothetical protein
MMTMLKKEHFPDNIHLYIEDTNIIHVLMNSALMVKL